MHITLTQSDIKRIIKDVEAEIARLEASPEDLQEEITERVELVQYLKYNVKLFSRDRKK